MVSYLMGRTADDAGAQVRIKTLSSQNRPKPAAARRAEKQSARTPLKAAIRNVQKLFEPPAVFSPSFRWLPPAQRFPSAARHPKLPTHPVTGMMLLIAIFSVIVLLLCWLCYSGEKNG
jgi:hypothetical protein